MNDKSETSQIIKNFFHMVHTQFDAKVKIIRSDNGREFTSGTMNKFYNENGIVHRTSCVDTSQQNGRVERKHRHILNVARAIRFQANLLIKFWGECVLTTTYLINRTPSTILQGKTPFEVLFGTKPTYDHIKVFGCLFHAYNLQRQKNKFGPRSRKCVFIGYPYGQKGWRVYDVENGAIFVSRDVMFCEESFPFSKNSKDGDECVEHENLSELCVNNQYPAPNPAVIQHTGLDILERHDPGLMHTGLHGQSTERGSDPPASPGPLPGPAAAISGPGASPGPTASSGLDAAEAVAQPIPATLTGPAGFSGPISSGPSTTGPSASYQTVSQGTGPLAESARPIREKHLIKKPSHLTDYVCYSVQSKNPSSSAQPPQMVSSGNPYPIVDYITCDRFSNAQKEYIAAISKVVEPRYFHEAVKDPRWREAMDKEIEALELNKTWTLEELPQGRNP